VNAMLILYSLQAAMTSSSAMLPPGWATYSTPTLEAWSIESLKGKKASLEMDTPFSVARKVVFSASESISGAVSKLFSHMGISAWVISPSMYRTRAFTLQHRKKYNVSVSEKSKEMTVEIIQR
jgi:hypothetical protein